MSDWTGTEFVVFGPGTRYTRTDGKQWKLSTFAPSNLTFNPVARSNTGTFVATVGLESGGKSEFWRSTDGGSAGCR